MYSRELEQYLSEFLKISNFKDVCPNGLQVEGKQEILKVGTAVSANLATLEKALEEKMDALVVHHGLFWQKDEYPIVGAKKTKIELLLKHGIALFAYHIPLDAHAEVGNNWRAANDLGWDNLQPFGEYNGSLIGVRGTFSPMSIETFVTKIENYYGHGAAKALGGKKLVSSAALISGGAYREIVQAALAGVDCFITGNYDEPAWSMAHEERINFLALGHSATERVGPRALSEHLRNQFRLSCEFLDVENPF